MNIKAIETTYNGYRFRSRLEARWAVFFDQLGIRYKYEEYGFEAHGYKWLPDFYLPDLCAWVEVMGGTPSGDDVEKMTAILRSGKLPFAQHPWPDDQQGSNFADIRDGWTEDDTATARSLGSRKALEWVCPGLMLLGDIPLPGKAMAAHPIVRFTGKITRKLFDFAGEWAPWTGEAALLPDSVLASLEPLSYANNRDDRDDRSFYLDAMFQPDSYIGGPAMDSLRTVRHAYQAARSARFEHGESGTLRT